MGLVVVFAFTTEGGQFTLDYEMCIRDSVHIERNRRNGLTQEKHLYLARRRKEDMKAIGIPMKAADGRPTAPVSYTHLDVYKRQLSNRG